MPGRGIRGGKASGGACGHDGAGPTRQPANPWREVPIVRRLIGWLAAFLAGSAGWWLGAKVGVGTAVVLGAVAGGAGMYAGYRWFDANLK